MQVHPSIITKSFLQEEKRNIKVRNKLTLSMFNLVNLE
mgnify:CR=1 FL=1